MYTKKEYKTTKQEQEEIFYKYFKKITPEILGEFNGKKLLRVVKDYKDMICSLYFENDMSIHITVDGEISIIVDNATMCIREKYGDVLYFGIQFQRGEFFEYPITHSFEVYWDVYGSKIFDFRLGKTHVVESITISFSQNPVCISSK